MTEGIKVEVEAVSGVRKRLRVSIPAAVVDGQFGKSYSSLQKKLSLPGYRKGHVPMRLVRQMYGDSVRAEVLEELATRGYREGLDAHGLEPVAQPELGELAVQEGEPMTFTIDLEVKPEVSLPAYKGLELTRVLEEVTEEDVAAVLEDLRQKVAPVQDAGPDHLVVTGDVAVVDFQGTVDGAPFQGGKGEDFPVIIGSGRTIPGFEEQFLGTKAGEDLDFTLSFPADYGEKSLAGREARFQVKVKSVKRKVLPAVDDEFARDVGDYADLEALRAKVREDLTEHRRKTSQAELKNDVARRLVTATDLEVPEAMREEREQTLTDNFRRRLALRGVAEEEVAGHLEAASGDVKEAAGRQVKLSLILEAVAKAEDLKVGKEEIDRAVSEIAALSRQSPSATRRDLIERGAMAGLLADLLEEKTLDFILEQAVIDEQVVRGRGPGKEQP